MKLRDYLEEAQVSWSPKKDIPVVDIGNDVKINFGNEEPIEWILVSVKARKGGIKGTLRVTTDIGLTGLKREMREKIGTDRLKKLRQVLKKYAKNKKIQRDKLPELLKEIEQKF